MLCKQLQRHWEQCYELRCGDKEAALQYFREKRSGFKSEIEAKAMSFVRLPKFILPIRREPKR